MGKKELTRDTGPLASRAGSGRPHSARLYLTRLLPGAQLSDLRDGLTGQRNGSVTFAANSDEDVRKRHRRAVHSDVARFVACVDLLAAYTARSRCYVAFMPWCLHSASLI